MSQSPLLLQLIDALRCLPGVGPKSAQRMAFYLLQRNRQGGEQLASSIAQAMRRVGQCEQCQTLSEDETCQLCRSLKRDKSILCVVESPADIPAIEHAAHFNGIYFVLMGHLSPIDGIGPEQLGLGKLNKRFESGVKEVILATNPTVEGEATAQYIAAIANEYGIQTTRIAHGVPMGGELEYIDENTLSLAFHGRQKYEI